MKYTILTLLFLCGVICAFAQTDAKTVIMNYLRSEGYAPAIDEDGVIRFMIQGTAFYAAFSNQGNYVSVYAPFETALPLARLLEVANTINREKYLSKCSAYESEDGNVFEFSIEFAIDPPSNTRFLMAKLLALLPSCIETYKDRLK